MLRPPSPSLLGVLYVNGASFIGRLSQGPYAEATLECLDDLGTVFLQARNGSGNIWKRCRRIEALERHWSGVLNEPERAIEVKEPSDFSDVLYIPGA